MKQYLTIPLTLTAITSLLVLVCGCSKSDDAKSEPGSKPLTEITVTDSGYNISPESDSYGELTRSVDVDFKTTFRAKDKIGVFGVDANGNCMINNLCLTYTRENGLLHWKPDSDVTLTEQYSYFAYYPYQSDMSNKFDLKGSSAEDFFEPLISNWTPAADQSDYETGYTASDLMVGQGTIDRTEESDGTLPLNIVLRHQMAMLVVQLPCVERSKTDQVPRLLMGTLRFDDTGVTPCEISGHQVRLLVKPTVPSSIISGSYMDVYELRQAFSTSSQTIKPGHYALFNVNGGLMPPPELGFFYYTDNSWSPPVRNLYLYEKLRGVIYEIDESGLSGKVMGVKTGLAKWGRMNWLESATIDGLDDQDSGELATRNMAKEYTESQINTIFSGLADTREYVPSINELAKIDERKVIIITALGELQPLTMQDMPAPGKLYWSSMENNAIDAVGWRIGDEYPGIPISVRKDRGTSNPHVDVDIELKLIFRF